MSSIRSCPCRVYNTSVLKKLNGVGAVIAGVVQDNLWAKHDPDVASAEEEVAWKEYSEANVRTLHCLLFERSEVCQGARCKQSMRSLRSLHA